MLFEMLEDNINEVVLTPLYVQYHKFSTFVIKVCVVIMENVSLLQKFAIIISGIMKR